MTDNWYEIHYGSRQSPEDLANFVKDNAHTSVRTLTNIDMSFIESQIAFYSKLGYFIDFFAPVLFFINFFTNVSILLNLVIFKWCPPCMNLLPEFRKASALEGSKQIMFGTVDCTINTRICEQFGVRSYPTTILFNHSVPHNFHGQHTAQEISDFVQVI